MSGTSAGDGERHTPRAALQRRKSVLSCDLPSIQEGAHRLSPTVIAESTETTNIKPLIRRDSLTHMAPFSTNFTRRKSLSRKSSLERINMGSRPSFGAVGSQVSALLKAKNAFKKLRHRPAVEEPDIEDDEFLIKEMPKTPRFASTLSPEAQYAMMKGYEDVVYSQLCNTYPEYRPLLRRNRTPLTGVDVCNESHYDRNKRHKVTETEYTGTDQSDGLNVFQSERESDLPKTSTPAPGDRVDNHRIHEHTDRSARPLPNWSIQKSELTRYESLPNLVPKRRQLVMTYRYQSAMDLLDDLNSRVDAHTLSPRPRIKSEPVKEFNSWSLVWSKEFETKRGKKNSPQFAGR